MNLRGNSIISALVIEARSGCEATVPMLREDGLRAKRIIAARRRRLQKLRESGFEGREDFEARAAELRKRLGMD